MQRICSWCKSYQGEICGDCGETTLRRHEVFWTREPESTASRLQTRVKMIVWACPCGALWIDGQDRGPDGHIRVTHGICKSCLEKETAHAAPHLIGNYIFESLAGQGDKNK